MKTTIFAPGPTSNTVRSADGKVLTAPAGWALLPPGDAALTRRVKATGEHWVVQEKKGRKIFPRVYDVPVGRPAMNKIENAVARFEAGCSCSQAVFSAYAEELGIDRQTAVRVSAGFGGGMGMLAETCGAVTGAFMILGLRHGDEDNDARQKAYEMVREFASRFKARHGSLLCRDLMGCNIGTPEGLQSMREQNLRSTICTGLVRSAAGILEKMGH